MDVSTLISTSTEGEIFIIIIPVVSILTLWAFPEVVKHHDLVVPPHFDLIIFWVNITVGKDRLASLTCRRGEESRFAFSAGGVFITDGAVRHESGARHT